MWRGNPFHNKMNLSGTSARRRAILWIPPGLYAGLIFHASSESDPLPALTAAVSDKALHIIEYAGLAVLLCRALRGEQLRWRASVVLASMMASAYAASDECHQLLVHGRDSDILDWLADTIGAAIGSAVYMSVALAVSSRRPASRRHARSPATEYRGSIDERRL